MSARVRSRTARQRSRAPTPLLEVCSWRRSFLNRRFRKPRFDDEPILLCIVTPDVRDVCHGPPPGDAGEVDHQVNGQGDGFRVLR